MQISSQNTSLFGYQISTLSLRDNVSLAWKFISQKDDFYYMACANPHSLIIASKDSEFDLALKQADLLLPDGTGIVLAERLLNGRSIQKCAGYDFFTALTAHVSNYPDICYFFLGSSEKVLVGLESRLKNDFPTINLCGTYSPPYKEEFSHEENSGMIQAINEARPDILWVGMTAPKQEKWIYENRDRLEVPFVGAIGAAFDFYAGTKKRSPPFWQKLGLEWLPRFLKEPKRLWERNLKSTPIFVYWIVREKFKRTLT